MKNVGSSRDTLTSPADYTTISLAELLESCTAGKAAAWQEFVRRFHRVIAITASRIARRWDEASLQVIEDLVQDTYLKLCSNRARLLREFRFEHPNGIYGFIKVVETRTAGNHHFDFSPTPSAWQPTRAVGEIGRIDTGMPGRPSPDRQTRGMNGI